jgi:hypothetical protein
VLARRIEKIRDLAENPDFISGIYNYCDKWCERCPFTVRCTVFAMEADDDHGAESRDLENQAFWKQLHGNLAATAELLREMAGEAGVDLDSLISSEDEARTDRVLRETKAHPLVTAATDYTMAVHKWFQAAKELFENKAQELSAKVRMDLPDIDPQAEVVDLQDATEVVRWYHTLISAKIRRAVQQRLTDRPSCLDGVPKDSDGSAKVALMCIDRSMVAWTRMREHLPEQGDTILDFLVALERLRRETERVFPDARSFVRPGFDDEKTGPQGHTPP